VLPKTLRVEYTPVRTNFCDSESTP